ncbi:membrane or secreted protein [Ancylomarina sp. 16SWW S1-10-2]|uniref:membrane or secreted protein n=1 Tax=Ancylomarina sp. 16SWW S1-10-2 TaxID=2499681 RepID=UPI0012AD7E63|nr:membrane or secreted protein [Ancylomarina sp. 16SWW S1-10-2]MRT93007.1 membrane or secreted protein [Ancylomarina sp. 16SWW S1-10-2]
MKKLKNLKICFVIALMISAMVSKVQAQVNIPEGPAVEQNTSLNQATTYVDAKGMMRYTKTNEEICAFAINYAVPFSYWDWRAPIGADYEKAIDEDVYHIARLGVDAYRIHIWNKDISDDAGNLVYNKHFRLFDYLLFKLKERNIKIFITPMYSANVTDTTQWAAQQNYLSQLVSHVNPYTGLAYKDDSDIIAMAIANEPRHWKAPELVTPYINTMVKAMREGGFKNPIFYNMTTTSSCIDAVLASNIQGGTFQWYPSGLTANHNQKGNFLPNVDKYYIPFKDKLKASKKAKFVYEFSPADIGASSHIYPAMARSFREAGFQFAAYFAYDPMHAAYCNVTYRTHFMNLAYTPKKAIGLLIASEAFHAIPLGKSYGRYPKNNNFESFHLSYKNDLAEMLTDKKFLYSNTTLSVPPKAEDLMEVAGTGNSPIVKYSGTGAYFLDKLEDGVWRLELMPDAFWVADPFFVPYIKREVAVCVNRVQKMSLQLPNLGDAFKIQAVNKDNTYETTATQGAFNIEPGAYVLSRKGIVSKWKSTDTFKHFKVGEYHAPTRKLEKTYALHTAPREVCVGKALKLSVQVISPKMPEKVELVLMGVGNGKAIAMKAVDSYTYEVEVPDAYLAKKGLLRYYISVKNGDAYLIYPAGKKDESLVKRRFYADDRFLDDTAPYTIRLVSSDASICIFNADEDWRLLTKADRKNKIDLVPSSTPGKSEILFQVNNLNKEPHDYSMRSYCRERIEERLTDLGTKKALVVHGHSLNNKSCNIQLTLLTRDGTAFGASLTLDKTSGNYELPFSKLKQVKSVLLPRPYPKFHAYWFEPLGKSKFDIREVESIQISIGPGIPEPEYGDKQGVAIGWIELQ